MAKCWTATPAVQGLMPRICGTNQAAFPPGLGALPAAVPVVAAAGQVTVLTTGMVHSASPNFDSEPRQCFVITFTASNVEVGLPPRQAEAKRSYGASASLVQLSHDR